MSIGGIGAGRKRNAGGSCSSVASCGECRLPASTMLYCFLDDEDCDWPGTSRLTLFTLAASDANRMAEECLVVLPAQRMHQFKPSSSLRLLQVDSETLDTVQHADMLSAEAEARALDGVLLPSHRVSLLRPEEDLVLIDNDVQEGVAQQLLTDMFSLMSLR
mmetsp:Transcript_52916/g.123866  ORF Transcript_52916/g.123866 Transcript_52916/m.123866 type:complete len:161 (+) Transcript_52916:55-537(+)